MAYKMSLIPVSILVFVGHSVILFQSEPLVMKKFFYLFALCGVFASIFYTLSTSVSGINYRISSFMFMHTGFLVSMGILGLYSYFKNHMTNFTFKLSSLLLFISGLLHSIMTTMQSSNIVWYRKLKTKLDHNDLVSYSDTARGIFSSQLGVDYAFDLFMSSGLFFLAISILKSKLFGKIVPILGILISGLGYAFNSISFPDNPEELGLLDPGPFFSGWFGLFIIQASILFFKGKF